MKFFQKNIFNALCVTLIILSFAACGDKATFDNTVGVAPDGALLRFYNAVPGGPAVVLYNGDTKISATSNTIAYGPDSIIVGAVFPILDYNIVPAGTAKISMRLPGSGTTILSKELNLTNKSYYSLFAYDTVGDQKFLLINDDRTAVKNPAKAYFKIINAVNGISGNGYDFYIKRIGSVANLVTTLKSFEQSPYIEYDPFQTGGAGNDSLFVRPAGGTANILSISLNGGVVSSNGFLQPNRIRNIIFRGVATGATTIKLSGNSFYYVN